MFTGGRARADRLPARMFSRHVAQRTVVLPEQRVLFVPVPKAGCTTVLWRLAELAGIDAEVFERSATPEVSPALTVHDMSLWPPQFRLASYAPDQLAGPGWWRFSLVRDPAARLWSAWQSKLLLREPRFAEAFGDAPWFPRVPDTPATVLEDFRRFVAAVGAGEAEDVHWAVQRPLVTQIALDHIGRVERLEETLERLRAHAGAPPWTDAGRRENVSPLPRPPGGDETGTVERHFAEDYAAFGYDPPAPGDDAEWAATVAPLLPLLRAQIEERTRLAHVHRLAQKRVRRAQSAEDRLEAASARRVGHARSPALTNLEEETDFNVRWGWADGAPEPGLTAIVRARDEAGTLPWSLPPLLAAVRRVVLINNGSTDGTATVARAVAIAEDAADRLEVHHYPFAIARCGAEHLATPAASVHSLAYFYNWSFAHVRTGYALKWDADMVLSDAAVGLLRDLAWQLEAADVVVKVPRFPLYVADERRAYLDTALRNCEPWAWPNRPGFSFAKALDWELPLWGADVATLTLPDWSCVEIKHLDADEFGHWSDTDFGASPRQRRKQREWEVFRALADGRPVPAGVVEIAAPDDRHVIEHVRAGWLPARVTS